MTHHGGSICFIENAVTHKDYRRQGFGRKVIEMATEDAKANNSYMDCLLSNVKRTEAHKFYESIGFEGDAKKRICKAFRVDRKHTHLAAPIISVAFYLICI